MRYEINFDLLIESAGAGRYVIAVRSDEVGEARGELVLTPGDDKIARFQQELAKGTARSDLLFSFGGFLFRKLFNGDIYDLYQQALGAIKHDKEAGLRIRLAIAPPEIAALPWELVYDAKRECFLATSIRTPLVRYLNLPAPISELKAEPPIRVLITIPAGSGLDVKKEGEIIKRALAGLKEAVEFKMIEGLTTTMRIAEALNADRYHIFHFIGHGTFRDDEGYLIVNSEAGKALGVSARSFARLFSDYPWMKLVILNACQGAAVSAIKPFAGLAPQLVRQGVPAVIAMQRAIPDSVAIAFSRAFYTKLCVGWDRGRVDAAISHARNMIYIDWPETAEFATPTLFMRSPTGVIFDLDAPARRFKLWPPIHELHRLWAVKRTRELNLDALAPAGDPQPAAASRVEAEEREIAALNRLLARQWKTGVALAAVSFIVFFAFWIGLFNVVGLDHGIERYLSRYLNATVGKDLVLILAEEDPHDNGQLGSPGPDWRSYHAQLITKLSQAKPKVIAFDLFFEEPNAGDGQMGEAINRAEENGTAVVLGARNFRYNGSQAVPEMSPNLLKFIKEENWGTLKIEGRDRKLQLASLAEEDLPNFFDVLERPVVPSLALQVARHVESRFQGQALTLIYNVQQSEIDLRDEGGATVRGIPAGPQLDLGFPLVANFDPHPYHMVLASLADPGYLEGFRDKIVLVGYKLKADLRQDSKGETRYGVEFQASAISSLLNAMYTQRLRPAYQYLIIFILCLAAWLLQAAPEGWRCYRVRRDVAFLKDRAIPVLLIVLTVLYALTAIFVYIRYHFILAIAYHLVALWLAYWVIGLGRKRRLVYARTTEG